MADHTARAFRRWPRSRLLGGFGDDRGRLLQVEQLDLDRAAARAPPGRAGRRCWTPTSFGLLVGRVTGPGRSCSRSTTSSPSGVRSSRSRIPRRRRSPTSGLERELDPHRGDLVGILQGEVVAPPAARPRPGTASASPESRARDRKSGSVLERGPGRGPARPRAAGACAGPCSWCQNSPSSTRWTRVPLTVQIVGGSGRCSMALNRKARAQSRNDVTLDGRQGPGGFEGHGHRLRRGCVAECDRRGATDWLRPGPAPRRPRTESATSDGCSRGPKWPTPADDLDAGHWELGRVGLDERRPEGVGVAPRSRASPGRRPRAGARRPRGRSPGRRCRPRPPAGTAAGSARRRRPVGRDHLEAAVHIGQRARRGRGGRTGGFEEKLAKATSADGK